MRTTWKALRIGSGTTTGTRIKSKDAGWGAAGTDKRSILLTERSFLTISALLFVASAGGTIYLSRFMSGSMPMEGGSALPSMWLKMPDQSWLSAITSFIGAWLLMMAAMMLPSHISTLMAYRRTIRRPGMQNLGWLTTAAGAGYFFVWTVFGAIAYPFGTLTTAAEMRWSSLARLAPAATGVVLLLAGCFQLTAWKAHQLECCRDVRAQALLHSPDGRGAWQFGLNLGAHCVLCCAGFMMILLVTGVMDLAIMALIAAAITIERLASGPVRTACIAAAGLIMAGIVVVARALGVA